MLRGKQGLTLTDEGIFFRQRAEEIVELADRLEQAFAERNADISGLIAIGASEAIGSRLFAKLIKQFSEKYLWFSLACITKRLTTSKTG